MKLEFCRCLGSELKRTKTRFALTASTTLHWGAAVVAMLVLHGVAMALQSSDTQEHLEYFEKSVRPILVQRCVKCHSTDGAATHGELNLESSDGIGVGGSRGALFDGEMPDKSLLLQAVEYRNTQLQMPPDGKLPESELQVLRQWIHSGAQTPTYTAPPRKATESIDYRAAQGHWAFRPVAEIPVPDVPQDSPSHWSRNPIDAFVLHKLKENHLTPSAPAEPNVLLRRLSFDLVGLPPRPEEINQLAADGIESAVDRLLSSPHFGERWARNWLDLARYSEFTPEWQSPTDRGWMYRDWVVHALNSNMPYDRFVKLQLAADLMPDADPKELAALGFIGLSPTYWKELRLAPNVIEQIVADEWDERIDAVSRTFLAMTVSCARCHDHKFDPISMEDYYGLAGVFASCQLDERPLLAKAESDKVREARTKLKALEAKLKDIKDATSADAETTRQEIAKLRVETPNVDVPFAHVLKESAIYVLPEGDELTKLDYRDGVARDLPIFRRGNPANQGSVVPRRFLRIFRPDAPTALNEGSGRRQLAEALFSDASPLMARVIVNRIWDQHFGYGLVRTPSDFGSQGDTPSHPELLEYLSAELIRHNWDLKWLHRLIVTSATYAQSSEQRDDMFAVDPENRFLWRMNRKRLDFEMWRDAVLAADGSLDVTMGGPAKPVDDDQNLRRTLYVIVAREELHPILRMHDFPEASSHSPRREPTTTPLQQLFMLNSQWMESHSARLAEQLSSLDRRQGIDRAYSLLYARHPDEQEIAVGLEFLAAGDIPGGDSSSPESVSKRWADYVQALLSLNEFHYLE
ncbi:MAG: PSD1 domain-containing protein [Planctomycetaceae bacterium]|nr:PSD1 domain-containing protein [Planctomycetaceae bacterium]